MLDEFLKQTNEVLNSVGLSKIALVGGFFGTAVSLALRLLGSLIWWQAILALIGGTACAGFVAPLVMELGELSKRTEGAIAFLIGLFGLLIAAAIAKEIPEWTKLLRERVRGKRSES